MRTLLHIGMPKTGSTALQDCLSSSRAYLSSRGVLYPENADDVPFNNHRLLAWPLLDYGRLPPSMRQNDGPEDLDTWHANFIATAHQQVAELRPDCLILSSEHLFRALAGEQAELLLKDLDAIGAKRAEVVVYVRRPSDTFLSLCQQGLRTSHLVKQPSAPKYRRSLRRCIELFGRKRVSVRLFSPARFPDGDVVSDFCSAYLGEEGVERDRLERVVRSNETISAESMDILRRYRTDFDGTLANQHTRGSTELFRALCFVEELSGVAKRPKLKAAIADLIDHASGDMLWLRDKFGIEFPGLDYRRLDQDGPSEIPAREYELEEMVEIDRGIRDRILREIETSWAAGDAEREAWVAGLLRETAGA